MRFFATAPFSMEKVVRNELERLSLTGLETGEGRVWFEGNGEALARSCVHLRCADRVYWELASFQALSFDELFDGVLAIDWAHLIPENGKINVSAKCAKSRLMSPSDVQRLTKMAIVRRLSQKYKVTRLPETGCTYPIDVHVHKDTVTVALDCCGTGLHKRGYRVKNAEAPLRETFAAGLIELSGWHDQRPFCDPFCGSGTLLIEAAMKAAHIAPGQDRTFAAEYFKSFDHAVFDRQRANARREITEARSPIFGADLSPEMIEMTLFHAKRAGVDQFIRLLNVRAGENKPQEERGTMITNPPYGERLGDSRSMKGLCGELRTLLLAYQGWDRCVLSGYKTFEKDTGLKADKVRRLYNGNIECNLYQFYAPRIK